MYFEIPTAIIIAAVLLGAFSQSATGIGFGVVAGPFLFQAYGSNIAILYVSALGLTGAAVSLLFVARAPHTASISTLAMTLPFGLAAGACLAWLLSSYVIQVVYGLVLTTLGLLLISQQIKVKREEPTVVIPNNNTLRFGGVLAGTAAYLYATPGPPAAWALASTSIKPIDVRSTINWYFVICYVGMLGLAGFTKSVQATDLTRLAPLFAITVTGGILGAVAGERFNGSWLRVAIAVLVLSSGVSVLLSQKP